MIITHHLYINTSSYLLIKHTYLDFKEVKNSVVDQLMGFPPWL